MSAAANHRAAVRRLLPDAVCGYGTTAGPGVSYSIYPNAACKRLRLAHVTWGWMTPAQAWQQAVEVINQRKQRLAK